MNQSNQSNQSIMLPDLDASHFLARWLGVHLETLSVEYQARSTALNTACSQSLCHDRFLELLHNECAHLNCTDEDDSCFEALLPQALRRLRNLVLCALIVQDLTGKITLDEVMRVMSVFADFAIQKLVTVLTASLEKQFGRPIGEKSHALQQLIVVGMGKLGGQELNVSSDVDLIFLYGEDGQTDGQASQKISSNHEFFTCLGKKLIAALSDIQIDGFVFRVDMALRPHGASGPLVMSFAALSQYLLNEGREWERYAWIKARPITGPLDQWQALNNIVQPFVYRRYLDFSVIDSLRAMHRQIRTEVARHERRHPGRANNIKLGRGGIREIEFIVQVFQLIRGGRERLLKNRSTRTTLLILGQLHILPLDVVESLQKAYTFLRNIEHRLQYQDDLQTHVIPENALDLACLAKVSGFSSPILFHDALNHHRTFVAKQFDSIFNDHQDFSLSVLINTWEDYQDVDKLTLYLEQFNFPQPVDMLQLIQQSVNSTKLKGLSLQNQKKYMTLLDRALHHIVALPDQQYVTLKRYIDLIETVAKRSVYLSLLMEYPQALARVIRLLHSSRWAAEYLNSHPILLDQLIDKTRNHLPNWEKFKQELIEQLCTEQTDTERQLDILRERHHAQLFCLLVQDLEGGLTVEALADQLSLLADIIIEVTIQRVWQTLHNTHRPDPLFAVIAYGKLGGKELGYASDLDLVFIYDDSDPEAPQLYAKLAQRLITWMTSHTAAGVLFDVDLALRPDGASGLIVSSIQAFERYQTQSAWAWEHQALSRARCITGPTFLMEKFEALRQHILCLPRDKNQLKEAVIAMRNRMRGTFRIKPNQFDLKNSPGGMIDIEFIVQYLILCHAHQYPQLGANYGNIALLITCGELGLIDLPVAQTVSDIYRHWRKQQHLLRLQGVEPAVILAEEAAGMASQVLALWQAIFGSSSYAD